MASTSTLTTLDNLLKTLYLPGLRCQINNTVPLFSQLKRDEESVSGKNFTIGLHAANNQGGGAAAENAALPDPGEEDYRVCVIPQRYVYWRLRLTGQTIRATRTSVGAFANALEKAVAGCGEAMKRDINRQLFGTGAATLCLVNGAVTGAASITCDNGVSSTVGTTRRIYKDMLIDIWDAAGTTRQAQNIKVSAVSSATVFTTSENVTVENNAIVTRAGAKTASGGLEMMGIDLIADSAGALQSLNPATSGEEFWTAYERALGGALTQAAMLTAVDGINTNSGEDPNLIVTTKGGRRAYFDLFDTQVQFSPQVLRGGWRVLTFAAGSQEIPILVDDDCPLTNWYFLNTRHLSVYQMADFDWMDMDGSRLVRVQDRDAYEAVLYIYANLGTDKRNAHGKITGATEG
jgi:hypothetical protein